MDFGLIKDILEAASYAATLVGIPVGIGVYLAEKRKERALKEAEVYSSANQQYREYLKLCLEHEDLDAFDLERGDQEVAATGLPYRKLVLFTILVSMLEGAFLRFPEFSPKVRDLQWSGWVDYMILWARRPDFVAAWPAIGPQFEARFFSFMEALIKRASEMTLQEAIELAQHYFEEPSKALPDK